MEIFLDTGMIEEIKKAQLLGIVDGVTTNPSLIAQTGRPIKDVISEISTLIDGPLSAEVISTEYHEMIKEGLELAKIHDNIVVKLPLTPQGIAACKQLSSQKIKTNITLCFSANQALLAAKAGATYVSPFIGRLDDIGYDGMQLIEEIRTIFDTYGFTTKILAASIRHTAHAHASALCGADVATMPLKVLEAMYKHPLTDKGLSTFLADHAKAKSSLGN